MTGSILSPSRLVVDLTRRLPDITTPQHVPHDLERYGRFSILRDGTIWAGGAASRYPSDSVETFYWALRRNRLFVSPHTISYGWATHITPGLVRDLASHLGILSCALEFVLFDERRP